MFRDAGVLVVRAVTGGLVAGHGAQKLFGAFEGPGLKGTAGFMEALGLKPGHYWGTAAALSEFGGGTLTVLGLFQPLGPIGVISAMTMATAKAHWGKPVWVTAGGAELPITNMATALALAMAGPGKYSLDNALGIRIPRWITVMAALGAAGAITYGIMQPPASAQQGQEGQEESRTTLQGGEEAETSQVDATADTDTGTGKPEPAAEQPATAPQNA